MKLFAPIVLTALTFSADAADLSTDCLIKIRATDSNLLATCQNNCLKYSKPTPQCARIETIDDVMSCIHGMAPFCVTDEGTPAPYSPGPRPSSKPTPPPPAVKPTPPLPPKPSGGDSSSSTKYTGPDLSRYEPGKNAVEDCVFNIGAAYSDDDISHCQAMCVSFYNGPLCPGGENVTGEQLQACIMNMTNLCTFNGNPGGQQPEPKKEVVRKCMDHVETNQSGVGFEWACKALCPYYKGLPNCKDKKDPEDLANCVVNKSERNASDGGVTRYCYVV